MYGPKGKLERIVTEVDRRKPVLAVDLLPVFDKMGKESFPDDAVLNASYRRHSPSIRLHYLQVLVVNPDGTLEVVLAGLDLLRPYGEHVRGDLVYLCMVQVFEIVTGSDLGSEKSLFKTRRVFFPNADPLQTNRRDVCRTRDLVPEIVEDVVPFAMVDAHDLSVLIQLLHDHNLMVVVIVEGVSEDLILAHKLPNNLPQELICWPKESCSAFRSASRLICRSRCFGGELWSG